MTSPDRITVTASAASTTLLIDIVVLPRARFP
jgi:hypothetical protein